MDEKLIKSIPFIISFFAIIISITSIIITKKNLKKQLRLIKLEEILEILHFLNGYYFSLFKLFIDTEKRMEILENKNELPEYLMELPKYKEHFIEVINKKTIIDKISRLKILSNAYLSNSKNLKNKIHIISDIFYNMYQFVYTEGNMIRKEESVIIPKRAEMERFILNLENNIIKEMNLGYKNIDNKSKLQYFKNQFKKDLENK